MFELLLQADTSSTLPQIRRGTVPADRDSDREEAPGLPYAGGGGDDAGGARERGAEVRQAGESRPRPSVVSPESSVDVAEHVVFLRK